MKSSNPTYMDILDFIDDLRTRGVVGFRLTHDGVDFSATLGELPKAPSDSLRLEPSKPGNLGPEAEMDEMLGLNFSKPE